MRPQRRQCFAGGCNLLAVTAGYCTTHYARLKRTGDVQEHRPIRHRPGRQAPLVCECKLARPTTGWGRECATCHRPIVAMWPAQLREAAYARWPSLRGQRVAAS